MKKTRLLALLLVAVLALSTFVGCAKPKDDPNKLTIFMHKGSWGAMRPEWVIYGPDGGAEAKTGIKLEGTANTTATDHAQQFSIMLTNTPLPDIIVGTKSEINKAASEGAMIPLDDLINQYAPNIKKFLDANPWAKAGTVASDGKLYMIPSSFQGVPSMGFFIRKDWLDKLGLAVPTTLDEYYKVLKAFREKDPNGNGQKDEIPYLYRDKGVDGLIQLWGAYNGFYAFGDNKVFHGKTTIEYKNAITDLAKWYKEGLIDPEIFTRGSKARDILLDNNTGGSTMDWFSSTAVFNHLSSKIPGFEWIAIAPPADVNGEVKQIFARQQLQGDGWGISRDNKKIETTMKYFDFWFTEEGTRLYAYGIENIDYTMVDGKPVPTDAVTKAKDGPPTYMRNRGQNEIGAQMQIDAEIAIMNDYAKTGYKLYNDNNYCVPQFPKLSYTKAEEDIIAEKQTSIDAYLLQKAQEWLMGTKDINAEWDSYIAELDKMGMTELLGAQQAAYDRYLATMK